MKFHAAFLLLLAIVLVVIGAHPQQGAPEDPGHPVKSNESDINGTVNGAKPPEGAGDPEGPEISGGTGCTGASAKSKGSDIYSISNLSLFGLTPNKRR